MKVLFDQNVPFNLARYLIGHDVTTAATMGWKELKNGDLIKSRGVGWFYRVGDLQLAMALSAERDITHSGNR